MGKLSRDEIETKRVVVMLKKDITTHIPMEVPLFEIPVIEAAFPEADVDIVRIVGDATFNIPEELERMDKKYGMHPEIKESYIEHVFGHGGRDVARVNKALEEGLESADLEGAEDTEEASDETVSSLRKKLDKLGIEYAPTANKSRLLKLLASVEPEEKQRATG